jgi:chorismate dehydratase
MKLGRIPFVNMAPFYHFLSARWMAQHELSLGDPRQLGALARAGGLDAAPFSYADGQALVASGDFEWLDALGIAGLGPIRSILLVGAEAPAALKGARIAVTPQTATTVRLLEVWLRERHGITDYALGGPEDPAAARLFIGDEALRRRIELGGREPQIDLCQAWGEWTGLPFVFARWAVRSRLPTREKGELALSLRSALDLALEDPDHVAQAQAERSGLPPAEVKAYLAGIRFRLGAQELAGASLFEQKLKNL